MIVNLFQHVPPSRPASSSSSRAGSRPPSVRRLGLKDVDPRQVRPFSARTSKTGTCNQQERNNREAWDNTDEQKQGDDRSSARRPITARTSPISRAEPLAAFAGQKYLNCKRQCGVV